ncbi:MAG: HlyD family efflux transporter periplasmic adaptor subunit, partial [Acidobacteriia bacterium]|nr:HlyD family efflux transporter periplasmic adaptor subunit [Terriglobia bacterium]
MDNLFPVTDQQLTHDRTGQRLVFLVLSISLIIAWVVWLFLARVSVYVTTDQARVEVAQAVYAIQAPVSGRVTRSSLELGRRVEAGEVILELENDPQQLKIAEELKHRETLEQQWRDLDGQLAAERRAGVAEREEQDSAIAQARAKVAQAQAAKQFADDEVHEKKQLYSEGLMPKWDYLKLDSDAKQKALDLESAEKALRESQTKQVTAASERQARIASIENDVHRIAGDITASAGTLEQLQHELRRYSIRAPGWGRLDSIVPVKAGAYIHEGDRLGAIVPDGQYRIVADFEPGDAIGRVRPGQIARLHLAGFPWAQYGSIAATVGTVGSEVRDGRVRVELEPHPQSRLPLQHGLPGTLEIATERISPALLVMRQAGGYLGQSAVAVGPNSQAANP